MLIKGAIHLPKGLTVYARLFDPSTGEWLMTSPDTWTATEADAYAYNCTEVELTDASYNLYYVAQDEPGLSGSYLLEYVDNSTLYVYGVDWVVSAPFRREQSSPAFSFAMFNTSGELSPGLTVYGFIRKDGGVALPLTNSVTDLGSGQYTVSLTSAELTAESIQLLFTAAGARSTVFSLYPEG